MKTLKLLFSALCLGIISLTSLQAQETTAKYYFFDSNWQITTSDDYAFFRKIDVYPNGTYKTPIVDYYSDGKVQCVIKADYYTLNNGGSFLEAGGKNGELTFFNRSGDIIGYQKYVNGVMVENRTTKNSISDWYNSITKEDVKNGIEIALVAWQAYKFIKGK